MIAICLAKEQFLDGFSSVASIFELSRPGMRILENFERRLDDFCDGIPSEHRDCSKKVTALVENPLIHIFPFQVPSQTHVDLNVDQIRLLECALWGSATGFVVPWNFERSSPARFQGFPHTGGTWGVLNKHSREQQWVQRSGYEFIEFSHFLIFWKVQIWRVGHEFVTCNYSTDTSNVCHVYTSKKCILSPTKDSFNRGSRAPSFLRVICQVLMFFSQSEYWIQFKPD